MHYFIGGNTTLYVTPVCVDPSTTVLCREGVLKLRTFLGLYTLGQSILIREKITPKAKLICVDGILSKYYLFNELKFDSVPLLYLS